MFGKYGQWRIVAHRTDGLLAVLDHGVEHRVEVFQGKAGGDLAALQFLAEQDARFRARGDQRLKLDHVFQPAAIVLAVGQLVEDFAFGVEPALFQVDGDHPARRDVIAVRDAVLGDAGHAGFGADNQQPVAGFGDAQGAQAVAILAGDDPAAIGGADRRRAVPRFHHGVAVGIERAVGPRSWCRPQPRLRE